jgi:predicted  nucleic acid-binding Zn-ribbon protein
LKAQLLLLEELSRIDARLQEEEAALKTLPERLKAMQADLAKVEAMLQRERLGLAETEKFRRELESQGKVDDQNISKAKSKLSQVKSGKDYMAAQREVEATRKMSAERDEETLKLIEAIEVTKKSIIAHEKDVAELRAHVEAEEKAIQAKIDEVQAKTAGERAQRDALQAKLPRDLLKKYQTIRGRRGIAVVPVVKGVCGGCHMSIPPQLYIVLQRGTTIEACPQCARIIYWKDLLQEKRVEDSGKSG